jgi:hypothetical protein
LNRIFNQAMATHYCAKRAAIASVRGGFRVRRVQVRSRSAIAVAALAAALAGASSCRGGCARERAAAPPPATQAAGPLALFPIDTHLVVGFDFAKLRGAPAAAKLMALARQNPDDQKQIDAFAQRTGLDPLQQVDGLTVGFPEDARRAGEMGVVVRAAHLDEARLVAYARDSLQKSGDDLTAVRRGRRTLWATRKDPKLAGFFLDDRTLVVGAGGWAEKMADLADGAPGATSSAADPQLARLVARAAPGHGVWAAALIPPELRQQLQADPQMAGAATVSTMTLAIDLGKGLDAALTADLATPADAQALVARTNETLRDARQNPQILMLGLGPNLDGITARADGPTFQIHAALSEAQVTDLFGRAAAFLNLARQGAVPGFAPR